MCPGLLMFLSLILSVCLFQFGHHTKMTINSKQLHFNLLMMKRRIWEKFLIIIISSGIKYPWLEVKTCELFPWWSTWKCDPSVHNIFIYLNFSFCLVPLVLLSWLKKHQRNIWVLLSDLGQSSLIKTHSLQYVVIHTPPIICFYVWTMHSSYIHVLKLCIILHLICWAAFALLSHSWICSLHTWDDIVHWQSYVLQHHSLNRSWEQLVWDDVFFLFILPTNSERAGCLMSTQTLWVYVSSSPKHYIHLNIIRVVSRWNKRQTETVLLFLWSSNASLFLSVQPCYVQFWRSVVDVWVLRRR